LLCLMLYTQEEINIWDCRAVNNRYYQLYSSQHQVTKVLRVFACLNQQVVQKLSTFWPFLTCVKCERVKVWKVVLFCFNTHSTFEQLSHPFCQPSTLSHSWQTGVISISKHFPEKRTQLMQLVESGNLHHFWPLLATFNHFQPLLSPS
jgi:hypothetical protein